MPVNITVITASYGIVIHVVVAALMSGKIQQLKVVGIMTHLISHLLCAAALSPVECLSESTEIKGCYFTNHEEIITTNFLPLRVPFETFPSSLKLLGL